MPALLVLLPSGACVASSSFTAAALRIKPIRLCRLLAALHTFTCGPPSPTFDFQRLSLDPLVCISLRCSTIIVAAVAHAWPQLPPPLDLLAAAAALCSRHGAAVRVLVDRDLQVHHLTPYFNTAFLL